MSTQKRLLKAQIEHLLEGVSAGLKSDELNRRAAAFAPPYVVTRRQVDFYRKSRGVKLGNIKGAAEAGAIKAGVKGGMRELVAAQRKLASEHTKTQRAVVSLAARVDRLSETVEQLINGIS